MIYFVDILQDEEFRKEINNDRFDKRNNCDPRIKMQLRSEQVILLLGIIVFFLCVLLIVYIYMWQNM